MPGGPSLASALPLDLAASGILRQANIHTNVPERARQEITTYTVQAGDTVSGIADRYRSAAQDDLRRQLRPAPGRSSSLAAGPGAEDSPGGWSDLAMAGRNSFQSVGSVLQSAAAGYSELSRQSFGSGRDRRSLESQHQRPARTWSCRAVSISITRRADCLSESPAQTRLGQVGGPAPALRSPAGPSDTVRLSFPHPGTISRALITRRRPITWA